MNNKRNDQRLPKLKRSLYSIDTDKLNTHTHTHTHTHTPQEKLLTNQESLDLQIKGPLSFQGPRRHMLRFDDPSVPKGANLL